MTDDPRPTIERVVETPTHGRYLVSPGSGPGAPLLVGFHGYAETAEEELRRLRAIPGIGRWTVVSVEGLHQFYRRRTNEVVASWMTRQNRELLIADNTAYVSHVIRRVAEDFSPGTALVTTGFSQGVAMAYRAAADFGSSGGRGDCVRRGRASGTRDRSAGPHSGRPGWSGWRVTSGTPPRRWHLTKTDFRWPE